MEASKGDMDGYKMGALSFLFSRLPERGVLPDALERVCICVCMYVCTREVIMNGWMIHHTHTYRYTCSYIYPLYELKRVKIPHNTKQKKKKRSRIGDLLFLLIMSFVGDQKISSM